MSLPNIYKRNNLLSLLNDDLNRLFHPFDKEDRWSQMIAGKHMLTDIIEHNNTFEVVMDAPGYQADEIDIHINENNLLTITGKRESKEKEEDKAKYLHVERESSEFFSRKISLPAMVDKSSIKADYSKGTLKISLPKIAEKKAHLHKVKINESDKS